jgi:hypothetical protein
MARPTFRSATSASTGSTDTGGDVGLTINVPAGVQNGDMLYLGIHITSSTGTIAKPAGWDNVVAQIASTASASSKLAVFSRPASSEPGSYNVKWGTSSNTGRASGGMAAWYNVNTTTPTQDIQHSHGDGSTGNTEEAPTATATNNTDMATFVGAYTATSSGGSNTWTPPTGMSEKSDATTSCTSKSNSSFEIAQLSVAAGATGAKTATGSLSNLASLSVTVILNGTTTTPTPTFVSSAVVKKTIEPTFASKSAIKKTISPTFASKSAIKKTISPTFASAATIASALVTYGSSFASKAVIQKVFSSTFSTKSIVQKIQSTSFDSKSAIKGTQASSFGASALLVKLVWKDTFSRTVVGGMGTPDIGPTYVPGAFFDDTTPDLSLCSVDNGVLTISASPLDNGVGIFGGQYIRSGLVQFDWQASPYGGGFWFFAGGARICVWGDDGYGVMLDASDQAYASWEAVEGRWYTIKAYFNSTIGRIKIWEVGTEEPGWSTEQNWEGYYEDGPSGIKSREYCDDYIDNIYVWMESGPVVSTFSAAAVIKKTGIGPSDTVYADVVREDNPTTYLRLGESTGTIAVDEMASGRTFNYLNVELGAPGAIINDGNTSVTLSGDLYSQISSLPNDTPYISNSAAITFECLFRPTYYNGDLPATLFSCGGQNIVYTFHGINSTVSFDTYDYDERSYSWSHEILPLDTWYHFVFVVEQVGPDIVWTPYLNSVSLGSHISYNSTHGSGTWAPVFGSRHYGQLDEIAIYYSALSPERIAAHYLASINAFDGVLLSAVIQKEQAGSLDANAVIQKAQQGSFGASAELVSGTESGQFASKAVIKRTLSGSFGASSLIGQINSATFASKAVIKKTLTQDFSASSSIKKTIMGAGVASSAVLGKVSSGSFGAKSDILKAIAGSVASKSDIKRTQAGNFTAGALINLRVSSTFVSSTVVKRTQTGSMGVQGTLRATIPGSVVSRAAIRKIFPLSLATGAVLKHVYTATITSRAVILRAQEHTLSVSAHLVVFTCVPGSFSAKSLIVSQLHHATVDITLEPNAILTISSSSEVTLTQSSATVRLTASPMVTITDRQDSEVELWVSSSDTN